jgi:hypothetical protein
MFSNLSLFFPTDLLASWHKYYTILIIIVVISVLKFLLPYISCLKGFCCDISIYAYNVLWSNSRLLLLFLWLSLDNCRTSLSYLFFIIMLDIIGHLLFYMNLRISLSSFMKNFYKTFVWCCTEFTD